MSTFQDHFSDQAASALARQMALGDVIGERSWGIDVQKGVLSFGDDLRYPAQLLGTHAFGPGTWLWVWANAQSNIPEQHTEAALRIRQRGESESIEAFTSASAASKAGAATTARPTTAAPSSCCSTTCRARYWHR